VGQDYADQRYYNSSMGRFWSPDRGGASPGNPTSWNRYAYVNGDPVNLRDPRGNIPCATDPGLFDDSGNPGDTYYPPCPYQEDGGDENCVGMPGTQFGDLYLPGPDAACLVEANDQQPPPPPPCTSRFAGYEVTFVQADYRGAANVASQYTTSDAGTLAVAFLDWGAWESGWDTKPLGTVNHNFFGMHPGSWGGLASPSCPPGAVLGAACFPAGTNYQAELTAALAGGTGASKINPNPNHLSYGQDIAQVLTSNPSAGAAVLLQAIANGGWNASKTYGTTLDQNSGTIQNIINCLQSLGRI
jgi:hypothetical protein